MHGIQNIAGERLHTIDIEGNTYTLTDMVLAEYGEKEAAIVALKPSPLSMLADLPPLPQKPEMPIPPGVRDPASAKIEYTNKLAEYQRALEAYAEAVRQRESIEERILSVAQRPRVATYGDLDAFEFSMTGLAWRFWRAARAHHPEIASPAHARQLIEPTIKNNRAKFQEIVRKVEASECRDLIKNSASPVEPGADQTTGIPGQHGPSSIEHSAIDTDGIGVTSTE